MELKGEGSKGWGRIQGRGRMDGRESGEQPVRSEF